MTKRLADYITDADSEGPSLGETIAAMGEAVRTGETPEGFKPMTPEEEEAERQLLEAGTLPGIPFPGDDPVDAARRAFDQGAARLSLPPVDASRTGSSTPERPVLTGVDGGSTPPPFSPSPRPRMPRAKASRRPPGSDELTSLFAAGMITLITFTMGEWALPTEEEANDLARPIGNILARRIDLAAKLGQDANDIVAFAVAVMAYTVRVGPVAADRARGWYDAQQSRQRVDRTDRRGVTRPSDSGGTDGVVHGADDRGGTSNGATHHPLDALAATRHAQLRALDRDLGYGQGPADTVDH